MSFSVFYTVRFSPAPELGEWLNIAVVGEGITEKKAGVIVPESLERIEAAFGPEAVERVRAICSDLNGLISAMALAYTRGEEPQPITMAMRDQALSISFSEQIMVFEGAFDDVLKSIAEKYLSQNDLEAPFRQPATEVSNESGTSTAKVDSDLGRLATSLQNKLSKLSRDFLPANVVKSIEQGQKVIENIVHGQDAGSVLIIGGDGHLGSALIPKILASGRRVRLIHGHAKSRLPNSNAAVAEIAAQTGVSVESVLQVLGGASEKMGVPSQTADRIRDLGLKLGALTAGSEPTVYSREDIDRAMDGVDVVIAIPERKTGAKSLGSDGVTLAKLARAKGVKRFIAAESNVLSTSGRNAQEELLHSLSNDQFAVTTLRLGELYGHGSGAKWFGDLHDEAGHLTTEATVNVLTAHAVVDGKVAAASEGLKAYLHVEDAVASILAVITAPTDVVGGQFYSIGTEAQIHDLTEIAALIKQQLPSAEFTIAVSPGQSTFSERELKKIHEELGFAPVRTLEEGIAQMIRALKDGTVSSYMALQFPPPEIPVEAKSVADPASDIQWEALAKRSVQPNPEATVVDQSIHKH